MATTTRATTTTATTAKPAALVRTGPQEEFKGTQDQYARRLESKKAYRLPWTTNAWE